MLMFHMHNFNVKIKGPHILVVYVFFCSIAVLSFHTMYPFAMYFAAVFFNFPFLLSLSSLALHSIDIWLPSKRKLFVAVSVCVVYV